MTDTFRELIQDASKTLTLLSKVRCVSNYRLPPGSNPKNLFFPGQIQGILVQRANLFLKREAFVCVTTG